MDQPGINAVPFDPHQFVECLLDEASRTSCDETSESFNKNNLPPFYDEILYKRGQRFFWNNIFSLLFGKFLGLLSILAIPSILHVLMFTKMSGCPFTAYRRYLSTVFHMCVWYQNDFLPGSELWESLAEVKAKHNAASKRHSTAGFSRITQKDMALTQFGFMGYALANRKSIGLYNATEEDLRAFVHVWRVIGHIMGIQERFNICRDSVEETSAICQTLSEKVFKPAFQTDNEQFIEMATHLSNGMWSMNPSIYPKVYLNFAYTILQSSNEEPVFFLELNLFEKFMYYLLIFTRWTLRFRIVKTYHNCTQYLTLWLMKVCPFLAYYQFGYSRSHVKILETHRKYQ